MKRRTATRHDFHLPIKTEEDLATFLRLAFGVVIPDTQVCPEHTTPWRAFCDSYFGRHRVSVWKASRGFGGKSYTLALLGLTEAVTLGADVNILGGSGEQSQRVHAYTQQFWDSESAPRQLLLSDPSKRTTRLRYGNILQALTASSRSVRGPHPQRLRVDEVDEISEAILNAALGQTMSKTLSNGIEVQAQTTLSSTHQYAAGTMSDVLHRADVNGWGLYEWCFKETSAGPHGWLSESEIEEKRGEVPASMWETEYELQDPSPESLAIEVEAAKAMFDRNLGEFEGAIGEYIEIEGPKTGASYAHGADWGRKQDFTVIVTFRHDVNPARLVAFERFNRRPWPRMVSRLDERIRRYGGDAYHDGTGLGDVVDGYLEMGAIPEVMVGRQRSNLLTNYIGAIERGEIVSPYIRFMAKEHQTASNDDVYGSGHLPDSIAAGALGYKAVGGAFWHR